MGARFAAGKLALLIHWRTAKAMAVEWKLTICGSSQPKQRQSRIKGANMGRIANQELKDYRLLNANRTYAPDVTHTRPREGSGLEPKAGSPLQSSASTAHAPLVIVPNKVHSERRHRREKYI